MDPKNLETSADQSNMAENSVESSRKRKHDGLLDDMDEMNRMRAELYAERQKSKLLGDRLDSTMEKLVDSQRHQTALSLTNEQLRAELEPLRREADLLREYYQKTGWILEEQQRILSGTSSGQRSEEDSSDGDDFDLSSDGLTDTSGDDQYAGRELTIDESGAGAKLSTGIGSLDALLGDALPKTSFAVIDDGSSQSYAEILLKHFISEAIFSNQDVLLIDISGKPSLLDSLPSRIERAKDGQDNSPDGTGSDNSPDRTSFYDLGQPIEDQSLIRARCRTYPPAGVEEVSYGMVFNYLWELFSSEAYNKNGPKGMKKKNPLRIVIRDLDGAKWRDHENLPKFVANMLRNLNAIVLASTSCSSRLSPEQREMQYLSDLFIRLTEISAQEKQENESLDKYHGFLHIVKPSHLSPTQADLVFEAHRKSFDVKTLHHHRSAALGDPEDEAKKSAC